VAFEGPLDVVAQREPDLRRGRDHSCPDHHQRTDGRQLPKDPDPRWYGYSVGKWEDDTTFVVQSNGTDERTWLDNAGNPHSNEMRVEERYHRVNMNTMELTVTIDDPKAYTKPWVARNKLALRLMPPDTDLMEMIPSASEAFEYKKVFAK